ncbi:MAG: glycosyltransferase family 4 protein [Anaerolineales bacterium]
MRLLVLNYEFPPVGGGGGRASAELCGALAARGHEIRVLTASLPAGEPAEQAEGYQVIRVPSWRASRFVATFIDMASYILVGVRPGLSQIREWQPDLVHAHFAVPTGALAYALSRWTGLPYILTVHLGDVPGGVPEKTDRWFRFVDPFTPPIWRRAKKVVAVSQYTKQLADARYGVPVDVIPNGIELQHSQAEPVSDPPRLIFAGRFQPQKNLPFLMDALDCVRDLPWQLELVGDGHERAAIEEKTDQLGLQDRVIFRGWVTPSEVRRMLRASDLLVMPSLSEGLPVVGVEALAQGVAIAATAAGGLAELVEDGRNGILCPVGDADGYIEGLRRCLSDRKVLAEMKAQSLRMAERYDIQRVALSYERIFREAAAA